MPNKFDNEDSYADLAVVGLGPGGLMAVLRAAQSGKQVVAFTNRSEYVRGQRVLLSDETVRILSRLIDRHDREDVKFAASFDAEKTVQTKDVERFLFRKLKAFPNVQIVQLDAHTAIESVGLSESSTANYIQLNNGEKFYCRNILAADGARHGFADLVNRDLGAEITYTASPIQERCLYHAAVQLKVKAGEEPGPLPKESFVKRMLSYARHGWAHSYQPSSYIFTNASQTKFNFAGEIPQAIHDLPEGREKREKLKAWASDAIYHKYGYMPEQLEYRISDNSAKMRLQATTFCLEMRACQKPVVDLSNGVFAQIGDARRTPNYKLGHGLNDAIQGGMAFADALGATFAKERYKKIIANMDRHVEARMRSTVTSGERIKVEATTKLMASIDKLITRLERDPVKYQDQITTLQAAKDEMVRGNISALYLTMDAIQPIAAEHKNTGILYQAWRAFLSLFDSRATMTTSERLLDDMSQSLESYTDRPSI